MSDLFRSAVLDARQQRLQGDVVLTQPLRGWALTGLLIALVGSALLWASLGQYSRTETVIGYLVPSQAPVKLLPTRTGLVSALLVAEGDQVRAGQPLARLTADPASTASQAPLAAALASQETQADLLNAQMAALRDQEALRRSALQQSLESLDASARTLEHQRAVQAEIMASAKRGFDQLNSLVDAGWVSKIEVERRRQAYLNTVQQADVMASQAEQIRAQRQDISAELARLPVETRAKLVDLASARENLAQRRIETNSARETLLTAPIAGRITAVQAALGQFATGQTPLMTILPDGASLRAQLFAPSRAIGFVRPGQEVRLAYDAFPAERFGAFRGEVRSVSRTVLAPKDIDAPFQLDGPVYRIDIALDAQTVRAFGETLPLQPGMTLAATLVLDRRSFLDWLLEPLRAVEARHG